MNNKKGFTLVEVTAVVVILGVVALIAIPLVENTIQNMRQSSYETQIKVILEGARQWGAANRFSSDFPESGSTLSIQIGELKAGGFVERDITDPLTREPFGDEEPVNITNGNGTIIYSMEGYSLGGDYVDIPYIALDGDPLIYVPINSTFEIPKVTAYLPDGAGGFDDIEYPNPAFNVTISGDGNSVDTSSFGRYTISYTITHENHTARAIRTVIIYGDQPPVITYTGPEPTIINSTQTNFNYLENISAHDYYDSSLSVPFNIRSNLMLGIPGEYIITYEATDRFGNTATKQRTVIIDY